MLNIKRITLLTVLFLASISLPSSTLASKQVSQDFANDLTYFSKSDGSAVIFSNNQIYQSANPSLAKDWTATTIDYDAGNTFTMPVAVHYKKFDYAISGSWAKTGMSIDQQPREIWRLQRDDSGNLQKVFTLPTPTDSEVNHFRTLVVYKNTLYVSDSESRIWQTTNGTDWTEVAVKGLPESFNIMDFYVTKKVLYAYNTNGMYYSTDAKNWYQFTSKYTFAEADHVLAVAQFNGKVYAYTKNLDTLEVGIWKLNFDGSAKRLLFDTNVNFDMYVSTNHFYVASSTGYDGDYTIYQLVNHRLEKTGMGQGTVNAMIENHGKTLFLVNDVSGTYLWRYDGK